MKKYIEPQIEIVSLELHQIMAGSPQTNGGPLGSSDPKLAPYIFDDEDEE